MALASLNNLEQKILLIRNGKVMLDRHLAELYGVTAGQLNQAAKRNKDRFPPDFMFQLTPEETLSLRSHFAILKGGRGHHRKYLPYAFTEQGVAMLSSVLRSKRAVQVNIAIMRAFVRLRQILTENKELAGKLAELEQKIGRHDKEIQTIFDALRHMLSAPKKEKRQIGFHT